MAKDNPTQKEQRASNVKSTLENKLFQDILGSNQVKSDPFAYGQLGLGSGEATYDGAMSDEGVKNLRDKIYDQRKKEGEDLGVYGDPSYPTNYDVSSQIIRQVEEVKALAKLSELEEQAKSAGAKLDFEVPEELKGYSMADVMKVIQEKGQDSLTEKEKSAMGMYQVLSESYNRACARNASQANYFADLNDTGKKIANKYKSQKK